MICEECHCPEPVEDPDAPGVPVRLGGTRHHNWCPKVSLVTPQTHPELYERLAEMDRCRRRAEVEARNWVIG